MRNDLPRNPVIEFLDELLDSGKTTKEKICVACGLRYPSFDNIWFRDTVSPNIRNCLFHAGILPEKVKTAYEVWLRSVYRCALKNPKISASISDDLEGEAGGTEEASPRSANA